MCIRNKELANEIGVTMGLEYVDADNYGWYGPAMSFREKRGIFLCDFCLAE